jgi:hypothetical protein
MAIVLSHVAPQPLDLCFTHACQNKATAICVVQRTDGEPGFSLMCDGCKRRYIARFTDEGVSFEPYTLARAEELDALVRATLTEH